MTPDEYLRELAQAITRQEDLNDQEARDVLFELALRIYALLLRELPEERLERYLRWRQLRTRITLELLAVNDTIATQVFNRLAAVELLVTDVARRYFDLPVGSLAPRPLTEVLDTTRVVGVPVSGLFIRNPRTGLSPFVTQLLQLLERSVVGSFFLDPSTPDVAAKVIGSRTSGGRQVPVATKGTVANNWRERLQSIVPRRYGRACNLRPNVLLPPQPPVEPLGDSYWSGGGTRCWTRRLVRCVVRWMAVLSNRSTTSPKAHLPFTRGAVAC